MPTLVIHSLGSEPKKATLELATIRVGRDPSNDLVLPMETVSREHAVFERDGAGQWRVRCLSERNPLVVDGVMTETPVAVAEGSQILVGTDTMLIFLLGERRVREYLGQQSYLARSTCPDCGWAGMVSTLVPSPACPSCAARHMRREDAYDADAARQQADLRETAAVDPAALLNNLQALKQASGSRIERADGREPGRKVDVRDGSPVEFRRGATDGFTLFGVILGAGVVVSLQKNQFIAESRLMFPRMKVNGQVQERAALKHGDIIKIGANLFRFATD